MIIDTHVHNGVYGGFNIPDSMVEEFIDKYNVDHIIVSNCMACENDEQLNRIPVELANPQNKVFKDTIAFARKHPGRIYVMPWIKPATDGVDDEFISIIENNLDIVKGIKFHAHNSNLPTDSPLLIPYIEIARRFHLPIAIHTGGVEAASAEHVYNAALANPDVNFIMVHMELGTNNENAIEYISKLPNLYGDTTWVPISSVLKFIEKCGCDRIVFGSDSPIDGADTYSTNKTGDPSLYLQYFNDLPKLIDNETYEKIMFKNAIKLFNLTDITY